MKTKNVIGRKIIAVRQRRVVLPLRHVVMDVTDIVLDNGVILRPVVAETDQGRCRHGHLHQVFIEVSDETDAVWNGDIMDKKKFEFEPKVTVTTDLNTPRPGDIIIATREQAVGALPNGTRIVKVNSVEGDNHKDGSEGTVFGSLRKLGKLAYFVVWDDCPDLYLPVLVLGDKVQRAATG